MQRKTIKKVNVVPAKALNYILTIDHTTTDNRHKKTKKKKYSQQVPVGIEC